MASNWIQEYRVPSGGLDPPVGEVRNIKVDHDNQLLNRLMKRQYLFFKSISLLERRVVSSSTTFSHVLTHGTSKMKI